MVADEQGFDPELNYTQEDNEFWDCTDGAHPAWWRGEKYGCEAMVRLVNKWLDKPLEELRHGKHHTEIQELKERILKMRVEASF